MATHWMDVLSAVTIAIVVFVVVAYGYRFWRVSRHNEELEAGGSMGEQMIGRSGRTRTKAGD